MIKWVVYYHDFNANVIKPYNIFRHGKLVEYIKKHKKKCATKDEFAEALRRELFYYFGSKCEWELIICQENNHIILKPWISRREKSHLDVTDCTDFNWAGFAEWVANASYVCKDGSVKFDVYQQVMYRFDEFVDYCWNVKRWIIGHA